MNRDPILEALLADPNVAPAFQAVFHEDYTPEELAIEAEERAQAEAAQEREDRQEREATRCYDVRRGEL